MVVGLLGDIGQEALAYQTFPMSLFIFCPVSLVLLLGLF